MQQAPSHAAWHDVARPPGEHWGGNASCERNSFPAHFVTAARIAREHHSNPFGDVVAHSQRPGTPKANSGRGLCVAPHAAPPLGLRHICHLHQPLRLANGRAPRYRTCPPWARRRGPHARRAGQRGGWAKQQSSCRMHHQYHPQGALFPGLEPPRRAQPSRGARRGYGGGARCCRAPRSACCRWATRQPHVPRQCRRQSLELSGSAREAHQPQVRVGGMGVMCTNPR
mmetsp:Transcript_3582/g.10497  ORF Transcript_3582/g.10497 Transcript_3582/m.10497 type:complete len:227 (+) Transcript_3582:236-916(+)